MNTFFTNEESTQQVKDAADIVEIISEYVSLKKMGVSYKGLCPFHSEKTPSFTVNPSRRSFHCFGCGEGGDVLSFMMQFHNIGFVDAVKQVADRYNITLPEKPLSNKDREKAQKRKNIYNINEKAITVYHDFLLHDPLAAPARNYLKKRSIPASVIAKFKLGFAPEKWDFLLQHLKSYALKEVEEAGLIVPNNKGGHYDRFRNRVLFPIYGATGKALGFGGRILGDQQPKYLNSPESPVYNKSKTLFGLFQNKEAIRKEKQCIIVEGNFDLLALVAHGVNHVTAPLGTALTPDHVRSLKGYISEAIILFDGDQAGVKAALRSVPLFLKERLPAKVVVLPKDHDPDTFIIEFGKDSFIEIIQKAQPLPEFVFDRLLTRHGLSLDGKSAIIGELKPIIEAIGDNQLQRSLFMAHFSQKLGLTPEQMQQGLPVQSSGQPAKKVIEQPKPTASLTKIEKNLIGFLVIYPEYLLSFIEAGLEYSLESPSGQDIVKHLSAIASEKAGEEPEHLLNVISGPERQFVSSLLMEVKELTDQEREEEAEEKRRWLAENRRKNMMKELTERINHAQQDNDEKLLMELLSEKNKIKD